MIRDHRVDIHRGYTLRVLCATIGTLVLTIALFKWWPDMSIRVRTADLYDARSEKVVTVEMIEPTRQSRLAPPPPVPLPPIEVPDDVELDDVVIEFDPEINLLPGEPGEGEGGLGDGTGTAVGPSFIARADEAPKPIRFVEPEYSREARRRRIRAQIVVEVRVDKEGRVLESRIVDRFLLDDDRSWMPVVELGYGVEEAVLAAADRWRFVPARHNGRLVESLSTLEFTIGG
jgi:protein TonB